MNEPLDQKQLNRAMKYITSFSLDESDKVISFNGRDYSVGQLKRSMKATRPEWFDFVRYYRDVELKKEEVVREEQGTKI